MGMRRRFVVAVTVILGMLALSAPQAAAQPFTSLNFTCDLTYAEWPGWGSGFCEGQITGVGVIGGEVVQCVVACNFAMGIQHYSEACVSGGVPPTGTYTGVMYVNGVAIGTFQALRVGTYMVFTPGGTIRGDALWIPRPPIPTCGAPGALTVTIDGRISYI